MTHSNKTVITGLGVLLLASALLSFSNDKGKKKYEVIHHSKGKTVIYDTLIPMSSNYSVEAFLADKGIKNEHIEIINVPRGKAKMMFIEKDGQGTSEKVEFIEENVEINVEIDEEGNKTIVKMVNGEVVELTPEELEAIENNMGEGQIHVIEIEDGDEIQFIEDLPEGAQHVEIRAEIDENGNLVAHKFVNGEEVELTEAELAKIQSHDGGELHLPEGNDHEHKIVISKTVTIDETDNGKEKNRTESHDFQWTSDDMSKDFTLVLVTEYDEESTAISNKKSIQKNTSDLSVYPNPNNGQFTIVIKQPERAKAKVTIVDAHGKLVFEEDLGKFSGNYVKQVDLKKIGVGTYMITVEQGNDKNVQKVMVQD